MRWSTFAMTLVAAASLAVPAFAGGAGNSDQSSDAGRAHKQLKMLAHGKPVEVELLLANMQSFEGTLVRRTLSDGNAETIIVTQGVLVRLILTSKIETELHVHGYDLVGVAGPETPAIFTFDAAHTGRFAIVSHGDHSLLGRREIAVAYIEVRPE
ncbi:hypothetical protein [Ovoidimarina sediminis]|uniref:hypothetical protein n=1 Tax=Ovoidimarina sediminis TaxID=3079856 RepID=UPI002911D105|nr:hypothetical protein [Rhodophyticola sp. MJ-SS7]MDU8946231.1 hypothetical protein [Rhodophyticola sp. MJ-SS7]